MEGNRHGLRRARRTSRIAVAIAAFAVAAGCQTLDPYTQQSKTSNATKGAAIGAATGAAGAAIISGKRKNVLIAAGVGALVGAGVGNYMDRQEAALRQQLEETGVSVIREDDVIILNMPGNVTFASNSADVTSNFYPVLDSVSLVLAKYDQTYVDVVGHTDSTGALEYNQRLSERRADSVAAYLGSREVLPQRLLVTGMGPNRPIANNDSPSGRALNRRVEIVLTPLT
jgi:outer membrane protein OmpA-like peptidoglycan-associated protein